MQRPTICVLTGSGISAPSGLKTFRDHGGLWEGHRPEEVATPEAWAADPAMVQRFYNERRRQLAGAFPNRAHLALAEAEIWAELHVITQNVDDLHERAGSSRILHLHGCLTEGRSEADPDCVVDLGYQPIEPGTLAPDGSPLRPNVVWFGEPVTAIEEALGDVIGCDAMLVVGTSLVVYPAASLVHYIPDEAFLTLVDPNPPPIRNRDRLKVFANDAETGTLEALHFLRECLT